MSDKKAIKVKPKESERGGQATTSGASGSGVSLMDTAPPASVPDPTRPDPFFERLSALQTENATRFSGHHRDDTNPAEGQSGTLGSSEATTSNPGARRGWRGTNRRGRGGWSLRRGR